MSTSVQLFSNPNFGQVRVLTINGDPWFVAVDVCRCLDLGNASKAIASLDEDEKTRITSVLTNSDDRDDAGFRELYANPQGLMSSPNQVSIL